MLRTSKEVPNINNRFLVYTAALNTRRSNLLIHLKCFLHPPQALKSWLHKQHTNTLSSGCYATVDHSEINHWCLVFDLFWTFIGQYTLYGQKC